MGQVYIGIDNGVSGSIGILHPFSGVESMTPTPVKSMQKYTKKKGNITRVDHEQLIRLLSPYTDDDFYSPKIALERPMVNPSRFTATSSALRCHEATLIVLEQLGLGFEFIDSKEWQKALLPSGIKTSSELKKASLDIGIRMYPSLNSQITKQKDADGLLIAHYLMTKYGGQV